MASLEHNSTSPNPAPVPLSVSTTAESSIETSPHQSESDAVFAKLWKKSTEDVSLTLYGFRRFKTSHLLNLRYLEEELSKVDHDIYQAGLRSGCELSERDRLGLRYSKRDSNIPEDIDIDILVSKLRGLVKEYDSALAAFNQIMCMETFSMLDDEKQCYERGDIELQEMYNTRLLRVDIGKSSRDDHFQRLIHKSLRALRYKSLSSKFANDEEAGKHGTSPKKWSYQNTIFLAEAISRFLVALVAGVFLVVPLVMLSYQESRNDHLITISIWIAVFSLLVSVFMKVSNQATLSVVAAYAAVLSVFVSNS